MEYTIEQQKEAIQIIGNAIANEQLKLSQKEHLLLIESFKILSELVNNKIEK